MVRLPPASPFATIQIGSHVDLNLSLSLTKRTFPAPDPAAIDPSDYEQLSRLAYAEPLSLSGTLGLTFHWDPTNGVRNNRIGQPVRTVHQERIDRACKRGGDPTLMHHAEG